MDWFDDWALTLAVFIPLVGMAIVLLVPKAEEQLIKAVALVDAVIQLRRPMSSSGPQGLLETRSPSRSRSGSYREALSLDSMRLSYLVFTMRAFARIVCR